jgi:hypothetical protein
VLAMAAEGSMSAEDMARVGWGCVVEGDDSTTQRRAVERECLWPSGEGEAEWCSHGFVDPS